MPYTTVKSGYFLAERHKLNDLNSRLLMSAVDFIDAALWLIGGGRLGQALVMLDNAIEIALKGELERIHRILIADPNQLKDFIILKSLLKDAFAKHHAGKDLTVPEFDIERTIYFDAAFDRVAELYPALVQWKPQVCSSKKQPKDSLHSLRNSIVHYGENSDFNGHYIEAIVDTAFPFLKELFSLVTEGKVSLPLLLKEWIYREIEVSQSVLRDLRNDKKPPSAYAIKTLRYHVLWTYTMWPSPGDDLDVYTTSGETAWEKYVERQKRELFKAWNEDLIVEIECPICESNTRDGSYVLAQVLLENDSIDENRLVAEGFNCFVCGLNISAQEQFLARHFVGEIPEDVALEYLKDIGNI